MQETILAELEKSYDESRRAPGECAFVFSGCCVPKLALRLYVDVETPGRGSHGECKGGGGVFTLLVESHCEASRMAQFARARGMCFLAPAVVRKPGRAHIVRDRAKLPHQFHPSRAREQCHPWHTRPLDLTYASRAPREHNN